MMSKNKSTAPDLTELTAQVKTLAAQVATLQEREKRVQADYQNLVRRSREERSAFVKFATKELLEDLITPIEHLSLAAEQLKDPGLEMVLTQLWQKLGEHGLAEINPMGQEFDPNLMEAAEGSRPIDDDQAHKVTRVISRGYKLNGEVIRYAKVIVE